MYNLHPILCLPYMLLLHSCVFGFGSCVKCIHYITGSKLQFVYSSWSVLKNMMWCLLCARMYVSTTDSNLLAIFGSTWPSASILQLLATTFFVLFLSFDRPKWWTSLTGLLDPLWSQLTCPTQTTHRYGNVYVCIHNTYVSICTYVCKHIQHMQYICM